MVTSAGFAIACLLWVAKPSRGDQPNTLGTGNPILIQKRTDHTPAEIEPAQFGLRSPPIPLLPLGMKPRVTPSALRPVWFALVLLCAGSAAATLCHGAETAPSTPSRQPLPLAPGAQVIPLWPPGSPNLRGYDEQEVFTLTPGNPERVQKVVNIHNPSIELHLASPTNANGLAIILAAGGGNKELNVGTEGLDVASWLKSLGVSTFILRYRLQPYDSAVDALADTRRSVRLIRAHAAEWGVDPRKIGIMGFSAGGEQAARAALNFDKGHPEAGDLVERQSDRPDFVALVYAGWGQLDLRRVPSNAPPAFMTCAGVDDAFHARETVEFYNALFKAKIPVELHIYRHGGHAGGIKPRNGIPFGTWPSRFLDWVVDLGLMKNPYPDSAAKPAAPL